MNSPSLKKTVNHLVTSAQFWVDSLFLSKSVGDLAIKLLKPTVELIQRTPYFQANSCQDGLTPFFKLKRKGTKNYSWLFAVDFEKWASAFIRLNQL